MISRPTGPEAGRSLVYLDANVLVAGVTRTLILLSAPLSSFQIVWSAFAEEEAARHQPAGATPISEVRRRYDLATVADADDTSTLLDTDEKDQPILAAAAAAGALFVVTENVKDFGSRDLRQLIMAAAHPDLFLSQRLTSAVYTFVLESIAAHRSREPKTAAGIHTGEVAKKLPLLFRSRYDDFGLEPTVDSPHPARRQHRGVRCVRCGRTLEPSAASPMGLCQRCQR